MTRYKLLKSSISLEDFEDLLAFLVAGFDFDKNQAKPCGYLFFSFQLSPAAALFSCRLR